MSMVLNIIFGLVSLVGVILTIYFGIKSNKLQKMLKHQKSVSWTVLQHMLNSISLKMKKDSFIPDLILCPGIRGSIIAALLRNKFERNIPIFVGISFRKIHLKSKLVISSYPSYHEIETQNWKILIPNDILDFKNNKILIVDDFTLTGNFYQKLRDFLESIGFQKNKIKFYCCTITKVTKNIGRAPEYYSIINEDDDFYFPWGQAGSG